MELSLAENIRAYRKQRRLTQEQLAEVLGVSAGAVYKWESGLSLPELPLIVELADLFDVSVDALLGYRMKDNREEAVVKRLNGYCRSRDPDALTEAEKALKKYPNSFEVVHICAEAFLVFGAEAHDRDTLRRALELLEQAQRLISQNRDPEISELTLCGEIASVYEALGEPEKGLDILKQNNAGGIFNDSIGACLAVFLGRPAEAEPYLLKAMLFGAAKLINAVFGYAFAFLARCDLSPAREIVTWGISLLQGIKKEADGPDFLDKTHAELYVLLAHVQLMAGKPEEASASIACAARLAGRFDAAPDYGVTSFRYAALPESVSFYDSLGTTAAEGIGTLLRLLDDEELIKRWKEAAEDGR